jgi:transcriptional regulator GlxA family with amidase domain
MHDQLAARFQDRRQLHVGILIFPEVEVLDFAGPFEVFSVAARIHAAALGTPPFRVSIVGPEYAPVRARHGLNVIPHLSYDDAGAVDLLVVPGGVVTGVLEDAAALRWVAHTAQGAALVASVCTGAFVLAQLGMLDGLQATTHWENAALLQQRHPGLAVLRDTPYVDNGRIVTSAGISAGIDMSLHLVGRVLGEARAHATARQMEYTVRPLPSSQT